MLGNVFQQFYNLADTWMVGKYVGDNALAAVGSSYTLLTFLNSVIIGLEPPYPIRVDSLQCQKTYYARAKGLIKCKIENGKWKINVGQTVCNVKNILCPSVVLQPFVQIAKTFVIDF